MASDYAYRPEDDDKKEPSFSRAGPGSGVDNPETVSKYNVTSGGKRTGVIFRWDGNGYSSDSCWIRAPIESVINLDTNL